MVNPANTLDSAEPAGTGGLDIRPLSGRIGAVASGVDLGGHIPDAVVDRLRVALDRYKVLFWRNQKIDYDGKVALATRFGTVAPGHPIYSSPEGKPHLREFDSRSGTRANHWHSDLTFMPNPPALAFMRSVITPSVGGDTMWASGSAAFAAMPRELQQFARQLRIVHSNDSDYIDDTIGPAKTDYVSELMEAIHPAVCANPRTGEPYLLGGGFARRVVGFDTFSSRSILALLSHYLQLPENTVRWSWQPGDFVIWDNLATQHYALYDYGSEHRLNERVTTEGGVPVAFAGDIYDGKFRAGDG